MNRIKEWILLTGLVAVNGTSFAQIYPSANTAWVIPGDYTTPTVPSTSVSFLMPKRFGSGNYSMPT